MNNNLEGLLKREGVNPEDFLKFAQDTSLVEYEHYNYPISKYAVYGPYQVKMVNVDDVLGIPNYLLTSPSFVENFTDIFADNGDIYHTRANGMLDYSGEDVLEKLGRSFEVETMKFYQMGDKFFVSGNGMHRFFLLKMHSLIAKYKNKDAQFVIPADVQEMDYLKTYVNFIGSTLWDETYEVYQDIDSDYNYTGKAKVFYKNKELILDDTELIAFMKGRINALKELDESYYADIITSLWQRCKWEDTGLLKKFISMYLPEFRSLMDIQEFSDLEYEITNMLEEGKSLC